MLPQRTVVSRAAGTIGAQRIRRVPGEDDRSLLATQKPADKNHRKGEQVQVGPERRPGNGTENQPEAGDEDEGGWLCHKSYGQTGQQSRRGPDDTLTGSATDQGKACPEHGELDHPGDRPADGPDDATAR
jgi:hypothetical protein